MKKIVTIVGARPQLIKTPLISQALKKIAREIIVHTGQHYDFNMSDIFIKELKIKKPDYNLGVGSDSHGVQTGKMLQKIEAVLLKEKPDLVLVYGDTNSTVAGSLAAAKLHIPVAHVEAGMRSYNRQMPEEINRVVTDHVSDLLFCPTQSSVKILKGEGITQGVYFTGDVMADIQLKLKAQMSNVKTLKKYNLKPKNYILATVHRAENTDRRKNLENIIKALIELGQTIIFPVHPRTVNYLKEYKLDILISHYPIIRLIKPVGFFDMIALEANASLILTDSGGVQKEAYLDYVPCVTLREQTEWIETVAAGWNRLAGTNINKIVRLSRNFPEPKNHPNFLGDGKSYTKITQIIYRFLKNR
ncbi:MAG: UDP-N-acetylglucosamine 2-epimerase (non-hydrolyzing) [Patescibacteria group bacterium]|jgi:UDP-N-acetylglucosamine 2-epimerase (non-hydrolysing)